MHEAVNRRSERDGRRYEGTTQLPVDIRIAPEAARFSFEFSQRGIVVDAAPSWFLPRIVGMCSPRRKRLLGGWSARWCRLQLLATSRVIGHKSAEKTPPVSIAVIRQIMWRMLGADDPMNAHKIDSRVSYTLGRSPDAREGVMAFLEKRPAVFKRKASADMPDYFSLVD